MQPLTNPEANAQWRDCCCHVRQSVLVAAGFMIDEGILMALDALDITVLYLMGALSWLLSGIFAIIAVLKVYPYLLIGTVISVCFSLGATTDVIIRLIASRKQIASDANSKDSHIRISAIMILPWAIHLISLAFDIWYLLVAVKCRRYLLAQRFFIQPTSCAVSE